MYIKVCIYNDYSENLMILFHVYVFLVLVSTAESYIGAFESFDLFLILSLLLIFVCGLQPFHFSKARIMPFFNVLTFTTGIKL